jgi:O-antigen/teichoic acid export membrane protein
MLRLLCLCQRKWNDSPKESFLPFFKKTLLVMAVLIVACVALLSLIGPPFLNLVYGQKVEGYTYLFTNVLISTSAPGATLLPV